MRRFFVGCLALIGFFVVLAVAATGTAIWYFGFHQPRAELPGNTLISIDFEKGVRESASGDPLSGLISDPQPSMGQVLEALRRGAADDRVKGLFARIGEGSLGFAQIQELRDAIAAFRARGKFAIAYSDSFGEFGPGTRSYYLATSFDEIWLQPVGLVGLTGLRAETPMLKGTLDLLGVQPRIEKRSEYKSAPDSFTEDSLTGPDREQLQALLASFYRQIVAGIAGGRKLGEAEVRALVDRGPLLADEALGARLIDHIGYRDQALAAARRRAAGDGTLIEVPRLLSQTDAPAGGRTVAVIEAVGAIVRGSGGSGLSGDSIIAADVLGRALRDAAADKDVAAILLRIDSPGGSAVASETIWRETQRIREAHKPLIVSMGDVAGSGGYYIAASADKIVAEPGTITGSIGVFGGKVLVGGLLAKLGAHIDGVQIGANADIWSETTDYSPAERERVTRFIDDTYNTFKERVIAGRRLDPDAVERVARGRVWSGEDAKGVGLVDALGGYETALGLVRQSLGLAADAPLTLKTFSGERSTLERLFTRLRSFGVDLGQLARLVRVFGPALDTLDVAATKPGDLKMPPIEAH